MRFLKPARMTDYGMAYWLTIRPDFTNSIDADPHLGTHSTGAILTQPRVSPVIPGTRPELAELEARVIKSRGQISPLYQILLNSPPVIDGWEAMLTAIR